MSINIKNKEAERLLAEIKARTGRGTTDLLLDLLRRERERLSSEQAREAERALEDMRSAPGTLAELCRDPRPSLP